MVYPYFLTLDRNSEKVRKTSGKKVRFFSAFGPGKGAKNHLYTPAFPGEGMGVARAGWDGVPLQKLKPLRSHPQRIISARAVAGTPLHTI